MRLVAPRLGLVRDNLVELQLVSSYSQVNSWKLYISSVREPKPPTI